MRPTRICIFAKAPVPGAVKTRLIPALGAGGAARLAHQMLVATIVQATAAGLSPSELCASPSPDDPSWRAFLPPPPVRHADQGEGDLGRRLARAVLRVTGAGENILLIGTDCPALDHRKLRAAAQALETADAVIHPTLDGGYALLGLRRFHASIFENIAWSGPEVAGDTISRIEQLGWSLTIGTTLQDIDEPGDLALAGEYH